MEHRHRGARQDLLRSRQQGLCLQAADSDADANCYCYCYCYCYRNGNGNSHLNSDTYSPSKPDTDTDGYGYGYGNSHTGPNHVDCAGLPSKRAPESGLVVERCDFESGRRLPQRRVDRHHKERRFLHR
jgi:hypothetical protein